MFLVLNVNRCVNQENMYSCSDSILIQHWVLFASGKVIAPTNILPLVGGMQWNVGSDNYFAQVAGNNRQYRLTVKPSSQYAVSIPSRLYWGTLGY